MEPISEKRINRLYDNLDTFYETNKEADEEINELFDKLFDKQYLNTTQLSHQDQLKWERELLFLLLCKLKQEIKNSRKISLDKNQEI